MTNAWRIELERRIPGVESWAGSAHELARSGELVESLARRRGVMPLLSFYGSEEMRVEAFVEAGFPEELFDRWFVARDGLLTVEALLRAPTDLSPDAVSELRNFHRVLLAAAQHAVRWRMAVEV